MADLWQQVRALRARAHAELGDCPAPLREARLLQAVLAGIPIGILDGDLLAGDFGPACGEVEAVSLPSAPGLPPAPDGSLWQALDRWHLRAGYTLAHTTVDYPLVLQQGLAAIAAGARARNEDDPVPERCSQREAMALALEAVVAWAERFADLAEKLGLAELAARCRRVPREPARDMAEAMQALWFVHAAVGLSELSQASLSLGRLDQYAYPYFAAAGPECSRRLLDALFAKLNRYGDAACAVNLGGADAQGRDCFNDLSRLIVDVVAERRAPAPILAARIHDGIAAADFDRLTEPALLRLSQPTFYGEEPCREALRRRGVPESELSDWGANSCMGLMLPGAEIADMWAGVVPLPLALELALNGGPPLAGELPLTLATPPRREYGSLAELFGQVLAYADELVALCIGRNREHTARVAAEFPNPFLSALTADCIPRGQDRAGGGARYHTGTIEAFGLVNVADALHAIRVLHFERGAYSLTELVAAAQADFDGHAALLATIRALAKFGDGDAAVDELAGELARGFAASVRRHSPERPQYLPSFHTLNAHIPAGSRYGASLDGRRAGAPLAKNAGPTLLGRAHAHTRTVQSAARLPQADFAAGQALDLSLDAESLRSIAPRRAFQALLRAYFAAGGLQIQVNGLTAADLRAAIARPEAHADLLVRLGGYSTRFVSLSPAVQREMAERFEAGL
ncbi:MAG: pyruvate formate lyase family protein [Lentisphaeria bacterium]|jgi:formate C-acetyltransferase|nr:pyruvate formate lyase family protein [Lentisphaeria bacterium]